MEEELQLADMHCRVAEAVIVSLSAKDELDKDERAAYDAALLFVEAFLENAPVICNEPEPA
jgi:hypothetical protein